MAEAEQQFLDRGIEIIWVLERDNLFRPGTAQRCRDTMDAYGSEAGWCVGDSQTKPVAYTFDESPFSVGRGFDIFVERETMEILYSTSHGTPGGNDNLTAEELLADLDEILAEL